MGVEYEPLLCGEDLELTPLDKEKIVQNILATWGRVKMIMPIFVGLALCASVAMVICAIVVKPILKTTFIIMAPTMFILAGVYALMAWVYGRKANRHQDEARELFEAPYITSWIFEKHSWETFAKWNFNQNMRKFIVLWIMIVSFVIVGGIFFVVMVTGRNRINPGVIFAITWVPFLSTSILLLSLFLGIFLYQRYRRFQSHVHCCVLSRGSLYQMGGMLSLQPATSCTTAMMYNLLSVHLERKSVDEVLMNILTINLKTRGKNSDLAVTVMVPVPDVMTQRVMSCIPSFVEGYTTEYTINVEDVVPMSKKMEPVTTVHQVNVTKDDITM